MKAIGFYEAGPIDREEALLDLELPDPVPQGRDLLVRVRAVSVNPVDTQMRSFAPSHEGHPNVLGYDAAGVVEAVGPDVEMFKVGDEVYYAGSIMRPGANAELHTVDERIVGHKPRSLNWGEAAALPLTAITSWELLFDKLRLARDQQGSILVINGAGGAGSILIQLARKLTGLTVIATASRPESAAWSREMGAHHVIDHSKPLDEELAAIGFHEVNYVASLGGSDANLSYFPKIIAPRGALAKIDHSPSFDIGEFHTKSITVALQNMFTRSMFQMAEMIEQHNILEEVSRLVDEGVLRSTMTQDLGPINAANLKAAHKVAESRTAIGKTVLTGF